MHVVKSKTMAEQKCTRSLDIWITLVSHRRSFFLGFCVLNLVFSLVATLGNLLVIRSLMKASTIPATVKKLFLSLAFSDLAVWLLPQLTTAIISAVMLKMASSRDDSTFFCPTVLIVHLYFSIFSPLHLSWMLLSLHLIDFSLFRSICDIRSLSRPYVLQWCWCLYG